MDVLDKLYKFYSEYDGEKGYIGWTEKGKPIPYLHIGNKKSPRILAQYAIHAREYITTYLAIEQIKLLKNKKLNGSIYFIPAVNIDGIEIALKTNPLYKANARGVDLNVNFDARWGKGKYNVFIKGAENYVGEHPFSEKESKALKNFTLKVMPDLTISYHAKGEEIYWYFSQRGENLNRDYRLAKIIEKSTGYKIKKTPDSCGGYKDWFIQKLNVPSFTIEVGNDKLVHPIKENHLKEILKQNEKVFEDLLKELNKTDYEKQIYDDGL